MKSTSISTVDVYDFFGPAYASRGDYYQRQGMISEVDLEENSSTVRGLMTTGSCRYAVEVEFTETGDKILSARCGCSTEGPCSHSAALVFNALGSGLLDKSTQSETTVEENLEVVSGETNSLIQTWLAGLETDLSAERQVNTDLSEDFSVIYVLSRSSTNLLTLSVHRGLRESEGGWTVEGEPLAIAKLARRYDIHLTEVDGVLISLVNSMMKPSKWSHHHEFAADSRAARLLINRLLATGRCFWQHKLDSALTLGPEKDGELFWETLEDGNQTLVCRSSTPGELVALAGFVWYVDLEKIQIGELRLPVPESSLKYIFTAPVIEPEFAKDAHDAIGKLGDSFPKPDFEFERKVVYLKPKPALTLSSQSRRNPSTNSGLPLVSEPVAKVKFEYDGSVFPPGSGDVVKAIIGKEYLVQKKDRDAEVVLLRDLRKSGLFDLRTAPTAEYDTVLKFFEESAGSKEWLNLALEFLPRLRDKGWTVETDESFPFQIKTPEFSDWTAESFGSDVGSNALICLDLGIVVDGKKYKLLPILQSAISHLDNKDPLRALESLCIGGYFYAPLETGNYVALPFERVKAIVSVLLEIFDKDNSDTFEISLPHLLSLAESGADINWDRRLRRLISKVKAFKEIENLAPPESFKAQLRPYQLEGIAWLNFLREFKIGGILADDMGLGKTVQILAHIDIEKHAGRLKKPVLVVCPTSVLPNWLSEIKKFTPHLKATAVWGPIRYGKFSASQNSDVILTTYALVYKDYKYWKNQSFSAIVLDEAQAIKNPNTIVSQTVSSLKAEYRICLTGTPIENSLRDLWSQFNFASKGLLRDLPGFNMKYRFPIEKLGDKNVLQALQKKVSPFLLRRTKDIVAKDLPEKTLIVRKVELAEEQRDLYETLRLSLYENVKSVIAHKGLASSNIELLDALTKMRQACCDPRLVSLPSARNIKSSAKLELLLEMLEELISEGRKILLFSQFTSMLDLIEPELAARNIQFVQIRGSTKDRETPVKVFQAGQVPLFLLSLKAGGTGLNLTAADTVIHYDPWWNPSVENQATDRAHRIGQDKTVFVFKLIAADTIEEKILELQEKKKELAEGVFAEQTGLVGGFNASDLLNLVAH